MDDRCAMAQEPDDFARALLRSAKADEPSSVAYAKLATALGVGTVASVGASLPVALGAGASGVPRWHAPFAGKMVWLGVSSALLIGAAGAYLRQPVVDHARVTRVAVARGPLPATLSVSRGSAPREAVALAARSAPVSSGSASVRMPQHSSARPPRVVSLVPRASTLTEQVQSLDRARVALGSGDVSAALLEIAHYRRAWPTGVFLTEASVLEIQALDQRGDHALAAERAKAFVSAHPESPRVEHLRALIPAARR